MGTGIKIGSGFQASNPSAQAVTLGLPADAITFQPGGTTDGGTYSTVALVEQATQGASTGVQGPKAIYCDFSLSGNAFGAAADLDFGEAPILVGLPNPTTGNAQTFFSTHQIARLAGLRDLRLFCENTSADLLANPPQTFELSGLAVVSQNGTASTLTTITGNASFVLRDGATMTGGVGGKSLINVASTGTVAIYVNDFAVLADGSVTNPSGGSCAVYASPSATIGAGILADPNIQTTFIPSGFPSGAVVFAPAGGGAVNVFTNEQVAAAAARRVLGPRPIYLDFAPVGSYAAAADLDFGLGYTLIGVTDQATDTVAGFSSAFTLSAPDEIRDVFLSTTGAAQLFQTNPSAIKFSGGTFVSCGAGAPLFVAAVNPTSIVIADQAAIGDGTNPVFSVAASVIVAMYVTSQGPFQGLQANAIGTIGAGGSVTIYRAPGAFVDDTYYTMTGVTVVDGPLALPLGIGSGANATASGALAVGTNANALGVGAACIGNGAAAIGQNSMVFGPSSVTTAQAATAMGQSCANAHVGSWMHGSGGAQSGIVEYSAQVTGNGTVAFTGIDAQSFKGVDGEAYAIQCKIVAWQAANVGTPGTWTYELLVHQAGGTLVIDNQALTSDVAFQNGNTWTFTFSASGNQLIPHLTGAIGQTTIAAARLAWAEVTA